MKNMKTAMKLVVSFSIVIVLAIIVGAIGIIGMSSINAADDKLYSNNLVAISQMGEIRDELQRQRVIVRDLGMYAGNEQKIKELEQNLILSENALEGYLAEYEKTIVDESEETAYFDALKIYRNDYSTVKQNVIAASRTSTEAAMEQIYAPSFQVLIDEMVTGFTASMDNNNTFAKEQVEANTTLFTQMMIAEIIVLAIAIGIAVFLIFYISGLISKPLGLLTAFMSRAGTTGDIELSSEDVEIISKYSQIRDEVGQCIGSTANFIKHLAAISEELEMVASGNLTVSIEMLSDKDTMGVSMQKMVDNLNSMFSDIRTASDQVSSGAGQVSQGAQELASGSSQQAASIEELSASLTELQEKTDNNAKDSESAREANNTTASRLEGSIHSMSEMLEAMKEIDNSSQSITRVIKVIDDIAFQTNILALNAAVEAARAGQHGKGFAVVADEVRNLAAKSAEAAKETSALIEGSTERVKDGNGIVAKTNSDLEAAVESARESTRLIEKVANASVEQAKSINEINQGMEQISTVVQANSATAEQSAAASEQMSAQAVVMNDIVAKFKLKQDGAVRNVSSGSVDSHSLPAQKGRRHDASGFSLSGGKY